MRTRKIALIAALFAGSFAMAACSTVFPDSHPGHTREFSSDYTVSLPTGDTAGPGAGGSFEARITSAPTRHNMRPLPSQATRRY